MNGLRDVSSMHSIVIVGVHAVMPLDVHQVRDEGLGRDVELAQQVSFLWVFEIRIKFTFINS